MIKFYNDFLLEKYGSNNLAKDLSYYTINLINSNFPKLLKDGKLHISIDSFKKLNFKFSKINVYLSNKTYGNINMENYFITNDIIYDLEMNLYLQLNIQDLKLKNINYNKIVDTIRHEFLHIIEIYFTDKNQKKLANSWKKGEIIFNLRKKYTDNNIQDIIHIMYLSLPHEMRSRVEQINSEIEKSNLSDKNKIINFIKNNTIYKDCLFIINLDIFKILKLLKTKKDFNDFLNDLNINEEGFKNYLNEIINLNLKFKNKILKTYLNFESIKSNQNFDHYQIDYSKYL